MGGEEQARHAAALPLPGLPPRGRGRVDNLAKLVLDAGITPAWAGKSRRVCPQRHKP